MAAHVDTAIFRASNHWNENNRVAFLRLAALVRSPSVNTAIGPERRTFDFPDLTPYGIWRHTGTLNDVANFAGATH
jgi:hypothetical protein